MIRLGFLWVASLAAIALVAAAAFKISASQEAAQQGFAPQVTPVSVEPARVVQFADVVEALGTAHANESVTVTSKVTEVVSRIAFESGDFVDAGDVLAELADAEEAGNLAEARSTLEEARRERARYSDLESRGVASTQALDQLESVLDRANARVRTIEARLADRIVRAPFAGVIGLRNASPGMLVRPGDVIATLDDVSIIKLDFTIPEGYLAAVQPGSDLQAEAAAYPGEMFLGAVSQIDSRVDPVTRTATVRAIVDNADGRLIPGMLMVVEVVRDVRDSVAVPELAIVRRGEEAFVFVVEESPRGMIAVQRDVTTGARRDGMVEILSGLRPDERVISKGTHRIRDGAPVTIAGARPTEQVASAGRGA